MKEKTGRISLIILFVCMLLTNISFAEEVITDEETTVMTMEEATQYALKNNANIVDISRMVKDQEELYDNAKDTYMVWKNRLRKGGYSFETAQEYLDCWGYSFDLAKLSYNKFLATKGTAEETVKYSVKKLCYTIEELTKTIECLEKTITKQENDVKIAGVKHSLNMITLLDVDAARKTLDSTKLQLESLKSTLLSIKANLKNLMGFDVSRELIVTIPENEFTILNVENLQETIEKSLETNGAALSAKIEYAQKENNYIIATKTKFLPTAEDERDVKKVFSDAEARLNNSINLIKENLYSLYNSVKNNEESTILAKQEYEQLQIKYNQMKVMHELGMITTNDFNAYEIALLNSKNTYEASLHKNILLNERWNVALKVGDVLAEQEEQK